MIRGPKSKRPSAELLELKQAIRARDGMRCTQCGMDNAAHFAIHGRVIEVHRVVPGSPYSLEPGACVTLCRACHGPQLRSPYGFSPVFLLKLSCDLALKAKLIAETRGQSVSEYLTGLLRPLIEKDWPADPEQEGDK